MGIRRRECLLRGTTIRLVWRCLTGHLTVQLTGMAFNGKEKDESGEFGNLTNYDYGFRIYNPGIGRFLSVDPLFKGYPWYTPYQFAGNTPIMAIDLDGLEEFEVVSASSYQDGSRWWIAKLKEGTSKDIPFKVIINNGLLSMNAEEEAYMSLSILANDLILDGGTPRIEAGSDALKGVILKASNDTRDVIPLASMELVYRIGENPLNISPPIALDPINQALFKTDFEFDTKGEIITFTEDIKVDGGGGGDLIKPKPKPIISSNVFNFEMGNPSGHIPPARSNTPLSNAGFWVDYARRAEESGAISLGITIRTDNVSLMKAGIGELKANVESANTFISKTLPDLLRKNGINIKVQGTVDQKTGGTNSGKMEIDAIPEY